MTVKKIQPSGTEQHYKPYKLPNSVAILSLFSFLLQVIPVMFPAGHCLSCGYDLGLCAHGPQSIQPQKPLLFSGTAFLQLAF